jgi:hypothetical protein
MLFSAAEQPGAKLGHYFAASIRSFLDVKFNRTHRCILYSQLLLDLGKSFNAATASEQQPGE